MRLNEVETKIVYLLLFAALKTKHNEAQIGRFDAGVVETVSDGFRGLRAVDPVPLDARESFLLDGDNDPIAFQ